MSCILNIKGVESDFGTLREQTTDSEALDQHVSNVYESLDPLSPVELSDRVNGAFFATINYLTIEGGSSVLDFGTDELKERTIGDALDAAKDKFKAIVLRATVDHANGVSLSENDYKAKMGLRSLADWPVIANQVRERLKGMGVATTIVESTASKEAETEETEDTSKDIIYSKGTEEVNPLDSVPTQVKALIATSQEKQYVQNEDGSVQIVPVLDEMGMPIPVDFHEVYRVMNLTLIGATTFEEMVKRLTELGQHDKGGKAIFSEIASSLDSGNINTEGNTVNFMGSIINNFENAFFSAFKNSIRDFKTVILRTIKSRETGEKSVTAGVNDTNNRRLDNRLRLRWAQNNKAINGSSAMAKEAKRKAWAKIQTKYFPSATSSKAKDNMKAVNTPNNVGSLTSVQEILATVGIDVSIGALKDLRRGMNRGNKNKDSFGKWVYGAKGAEDGTVPLHKLVKDFYTGDVDIFSNESSTIVRLAKLQALHEKDISSGSYINGKKNQVYPVGLPTGASEMFEEFSEDTEGERLVQFSEDPLMKKFNMIRAFKDASKSALKPAMSYFDTIYNRDNDKGTSYDELDPVSAIAARIELFQNRNKGGNANAQTGWVMVPTPADRTGSRIIKAPKVKGFDWAGGTLLRGSKYKQWLIDQAQGEYDRIKAVREDINSGLSRESLIKGYHLNGNKVGSGGFFQYFEELNPLLLNEDGSFNADLDIQRDITIHDMLEAAAYEQYKADVNYLVEVGFLDSHTNYKDFVFSKQAKKLAHPDSLTVKSIQGFLANAAVYNMELSTMFNGDLAHFGSYEKANKRAGLSDTPGKKLRIGPSGARPTFNVGFFNDIKTMNEELAKQFPAYNDIDVTDGQGFVSLERYAEILAGQGLLSKEVARTIEDLMDDSKTPNWDNVKEVLQPIKGFLQGQRYDENFGRVMPTNLKYSLLPLIPETFKNNTTMMRLHGKMVESGIDEAVFLTGSKFGAYNVNTLSDNTAAKTVEMSNLDWRMPQVMPYKEKTMENQGTQIRKLITVNVNKEAMYGDKTGAEMLNDYQSALAGNLQDSYLRYYNSVSYPNEEGTLVPDAEKMAAKVLEALRNSEYTNVPDYFKEALEPVLDEDGNVTTSIPMGFPTIRNRVDSTINSGVRKAVTKQKLPGFSAVQFAAVGFSKSEVSTDESLLFVRKDANGNVLPAQVKMSPQYFVGVLKKQPQSEERDTMIEQLEQGTFNAKDLGGELSKSVLYRIPYQGKNAGIPIEIIGFLPRAQGSAIVLPPEVTVQAGSDYDFDKVWVEIKHFELTKDGMSTLPSGLKSKKERDNLIIDTHYSILTSPEHYNEVITPNNSDTLSKLSKKISKKISEIFSADKVGRKWSSLSTQDDFRDKNQAGSVFIGLASDANTMHAIFQDLGVKLSAPVQIGGSMVRSLGNKFTNSAKYDNKQNTSSDPGYIAKSPEVGGVKLISEEEYLKDSKLGQSGLSIGLPVRYTHTYFKLGKNSVIGNIQDPVNGKYTFNEPVGKGSLVRNGDKYFVVREDGKANVPVTDITSEINKIGDVPGPIYLEEDGGVGIVPESSAEGKELTKNSSKGDVQTKAEPKSGRLISDDHIEVQTAAVDNANDPILGNLNINTITGNAYLFLVEAGAGLDFSSKVVSSPIVRELTKRVRQYESTLGKDTAFNNALSDLLADRKIDPKSMMDQEGDVSEAILDMSFEEFSKGSKATSYDRDILLAFLTYRKYGNSLKSMISALKMDNRGPSSTTAGNFLQLEALATVPGTLSHQRYKDSENQTHPRENQHFSIPPESWKNHSMAYYERMGVMGALEISEFFIEDNTKTMVNAIRQYQEKAGGFIDEHDIRLLTNDFYTYLFNNKNANNQGLTSLLSDVLTPEVVESLISGENSVAKQVNRMQRNEIARGKTDITYRKNDFIMSLTPTIRDQATGLDLVSFNNTMSQSLTSEQKTMITNEFSLLFDNPDTAGLAKDLFLYSMATEGFNKGSNSFSEYIDVAHFESVRGKSNQNLVEFFKEAATDMYFTPENFNIDEFVMLFMRNRGTQLNGLKDMTNLTPKRIKSFLKSNPQTKYFTIKDGGHIKLARAESYDGKNPDGAYKGIATVNEAPNTMVHYTGFNVLTTISATEALEKAKIAGDVTEEEGSNCVVMSF